MRIIAGKKKPRKGFSFLEILLAVSLTVFIGAGIYKVFSSGLSLWKAGRADLAGEDMDLFFAKFSKDINNCISTDFQASMHRVSFLVHNPSFLLSSEKQIETSSDTLFPIYRVEYVFSPADKSLIKRVYSLGRADYQSEVKAVSQAEDITFSFYVKKGDSLVKTSALEGELPYAVEIKADLSDLHKGESLPVKVIKLPSGTVSY